MAIKPPENLIKEKPQLDWLLQWFKSLNQSHLLQAASMALIVALSVLILRSEALIRFEYLLLDILIRSKPPIQASSNIVFIEIAEDTLQVIRERPFPRQYHGIMAEILKKWGAKAVLFNYLFEGKTTPFDDEVFAESLKINAGNVYFPVVAEKIGKKHSLLRSITEFESHARGIGHINMQTDQDGILRRFQPFVQVSGNYYPHIGLKIAYDILGKPIRSPQDLPFKTDESGAVFIDWAGSWTDTFQHYSYLDVLKSFELAQKWKKPLIDPKSFKDKICIVGHTAAGETDIKTTPIDSAFPGAGVIGNIINAGFHGKFARPATVNQNQAVLIVLGLCATLFLIPFKNFISFLYIVVLIVIWIGTAYFLFLKHGVWFNLFQPINLILILFVFSALFSKSVSDREKILLYKLSTIDGLTKMAVRRYFEVRAKHEFEKAKHLKQTLSMVLLDIDHFKKINDTYGHQAGDSVLQQVAGIIHSVIRFQKGYRAGDIVGRYGGEEFILLLPGTDIKAAAFTVAERLRHAVQANPIPVDGKLIPVTISLGVASIHKSDSKFETIIKRADDALYRSKEEGRNRTSLETF